MSNPIQQAIEALKLANETSYSEANCEKFNAALSALQSLQGVELPPLPAHTDECNALWDHVYEYGQTAEGVHERLEAVCKAYARTAVAAALGRGAVPQDATKEMLAAACEVDWSNEDAEAVAQNIWHAMLSAAPSPDATQPTQAEAPSERERFDAYWLKRQRERGFGARLTDAEMLAHPSDRDDEFHAWCAALATQQAVQGEAVAQPTPEMLTTFKEAFEGGSIWTNRVAHGLAEVFRVHKLYATPPAPQQPEARKCHYNGGTCTRRGCAIECQGSALASQVAQQPEALAQQAGGEPVAVAHKGRHVGSDRVHISRLDALEDLPDGVHNLYAGAAPMQQERDREDAELLDWLSNQFVTVRIPMRYGSRKCFMGSPDDNDGEFMPWDIRAAIRAARSSEGGSPSPSMVGKEDTTHE